MRHTAKVLPYLGLLAAACFFGYLGGRAVQDCALASAPVYINQRTVPGNLRPLGVVPMPTISSAASLSVPGGAEFAVIQPETQNVRWRDDGTAPTATVGMLIQAGDTLEYDGDLSALQLIETAATAGGHIAFYSTD